MATTGNTAPLSRRERPGPTTLRRLYVVEQWSTADLQAQYQVGSRAMRRWLLEAGIEVRPRGSGGFRRQLTAPLRRELADLGRSWATPDIARRLGVSPATVRRWFAEAGLVPPSGSLKNRSRGALAPVQRPTADQLRKLYVQDGLSMTGVADAVDSTPHLVRTWLLEDDIAIRPAGGRRGFSRPGKVRKPSPPAAELRRLREQERLSRGELAARYQVHPQTVSGWLSAAGLPGTLPPAGPVVSDAQVTGMYRAEPITASEIARRLGISTTQVSGGAAPRRGRNRPRPASRRGSGRQCPPPRHGACPARPSSRAGGAVHYQEQGWSYRTIGEALGVSYAKVRVELQRRGVPVYRRQPVGPGSRASRTEAPVEKLRTLYVESQWSAQDVAAQLDSTVHVVLRTGHAHRVPIRQGGGGRPAVTATVALIDSLYQDEQISEVLERHGVPRRPAGGDIAVRFPDPVPITAQQQP